VRADDDTEYEALRHLDDEPLDVIIERLVARERGSEHTKDLLRRVFRRLAAGADEHELGSELGYTRSHIQMVLARYRKHAGRWL